MPQYLVKPVNRIYAGGQNVNIQEFKVGANATPAKMLPGRWVVYDAADGAVKESGAKASDVMGILEVDSGMLLTDNYAAAAMCKVIPLVSGVYVMCTLVAGAGNVVVMGDGVVTAADGKTAKLAVGAIGTQGTITGKVLLAEDPTAADKTCLVELVGGRQAAAAA